MNADFIHILLEMRNGQVAADINRKLGELMDSVLETASVKGGRLILELNIKPSKFALGGTVVEVETSHECRIKKPELKIGRSLFFVAKDGELTRDDPNQEDMFINEEKQNSERPNNKR